MNQIEKEISDFHKSQESNINSLGKSDFELFKSVTLNLLQSCDSKESFEKSWSTDLQKQFPDGVWRKINGASVFINHGRVVAGLDKFNGMIDDFFNKKESKEQSKVEEKKDFKSMYEDIDKTFNTPINATITTKIKDLPFKIIPKINKSNDRFTFTANVGGEIYELKPLIHPQYGTGLSVTMTPSQVKKNLGADVSGNASLYIKDIKHKDLEQIGKNYSNEVNSLAQKEINSFYNSDKEIVAKPNYGGFGVIYTIESDSLSNNAKGLISKNFSNLKSGQDLLRDENNPDGFYKVKIKDIIDNINSKLEKKKIAESERKAIFDLAKKTNKKQYLEHYITDSYGDRIQNTEYAMPDGTVKTEKVNLDDI